MSEPTMPQRAEIDPKYTFDLEALFSSVAEWETAFAALEHDLPTLTRFEGRLCESGQTLLEYLELNAAYEARLNRVWLYAHLRVEADSSDEIATQLLTRWQALLNRASTATAWERTELLDLGSERFEAFRREEPGLEVWAWHVEDLLQRQPHMRSTEVESLLGEFEQVMNRVNTQYATLHREMRYEPIEDESGKILEVNLATMPQLNSSPNREVRRRVDRSESQTHIQHQDSFAALLQTEIKRRTLIARARNHPSSLGHALFEAGLSKPVFDATIATFTEHLPLWHRYWDLKRRAHQVATLESCDFVTSLAGELPKVPYEQAAQWVSDAMQPLGEGYANVLRCGLTLERWVDVYPTRHKSFREYSLTVDGSKPYILLWYYGTQKSVSTLAHESGHSMHSHYAFKTQPHQYAGYGVTAAEVAATFHQAMLTAHLLETNPDPRFQLAVLQEEIETFVRYLFRMPLRARFEAELHSRVERGESLIAERLTERFTELCVEAYGPAVTFTPEDGVAWTQAIVLYQHFSSFQYVLGLAGGQAIAQRVLSGDMNTVEDYLKFISAGRSRSQLEVLQLAGLDFTQTGPITLAFEGLKARIDRLEKLLSEITNIEAARNLTV
jgi:oligoendopeptidase F